MLNHEKPCRYMDSCSLHHNQIEFSLISPLKLSTLGTLLSYFEHMRFIQNLPPLNQLMNFYDRSLHQSCKLFVHVMVVKVVLAKLTTMFMNACLIDGGRMFLFSNCNLLCIYMDDFCFKKISYVL